MQMSTIEIADQDLAALTHELGLQEQTCTYATVTFGLWYRFLRSVRALLLSAQIAFGALAVWKVLSSDLGWATVIFVVLAAMISPLLSAMRIADEIASAKAAGAEFSALRDRFRRAASIQSLRSREELDRAAEPLFIRLERARAETTAPPELFYSVAIRRVRKGRYRSD